MRSSHAGSRPTFSQRAEDDPRPQQQRPVAVRRRDRALAPGLQLAVVPVVGTGVGRALLGSAGLVGGLAGPLGAGGQRRHEGVAARRPGEQGGGRADDPRHEAGGVDDRVPGPAAELSRSPATRAVAVHRLDARRVGAVTPRLNVVTRSPRASAASTYARPRNEVPPSTSRSMRPTLTRAAADAPDPFALGVSPAREAAGWRLRWLDATVDGLRNPLAPRVALAADGTARRRRRDPLRRARAVRVDRPAALGEPRALGAGERRRRARLRRRGGGAADPAVGRLRERGAVRRGVPGERADGAGLARRAARLAGNPVVAWGRLPLQVPLVLWAWSVAVAAAVSDRAAADRARPGGPAAPGVPPRAGRAG